MPPKPESLFRILVLADFSGRQNRGQTGASPDIAARRLVRVSRENLDEVMAKMGVRLTLPAGNGVAVNLSFNSLEDFHPDRIHDRVSYIADYDEVDQKTLWMNWVLHHPDFQALESAWRGLDWLLVRAAKGSTVEFVLLDISLAELTGDLKASENLTASGIHQLLIDKGVRGPYGQPWGAIVGNYLFDLTGPHAELLGRLAKIFRQANAPFLTTVDPKVLQPSFAFSADDAPAWQALRQLPEASLLGLAVPRFLLRLPYGENTQSIDKFSFEEMSLPPERSQYLWGNPALACAALLAQAFQKAGWAFKPGSVLDLEGLPIHVYSQDGEEAVTLAEAWFVKPQPEQLVKKGIMPFLCVRGKGSLQLAQFLSLAQPAKDQPAGDLQGHWGQPFAAPVQPVSAPLAPKVGMVGQVPDPPRRVAPPAVQAPSTAAVVPVAAAKVAAPPVAAPAAPPAEPEAPPAEEEMDPELAALLKSLE